MGKPRANSTIHMLERAICILGNIYLASLLIAVLFVPFCLVLSRMCGLHPTRICIFFWKVFSFELLGLKVDVGWVPLGSSIAYRDGEFDALATIRAVGLMVAGLIPTLLIALVYCWWAGNLTEMQAALGQIWSGSMAPFSRGVELVRKFSEIAQGSVSAVSIGLLSTKLFVFYLLGVLIFCAARLVHQSNDTSKRSSFIMTGVMVLYFAYFVWLLAVGKFILWG